MALQTSTKLCDDQLLSQLLTRKDYQKFCYLNPQEYQFISTLDADFERFHGPNLIIIRFHKKQKTCT